LIGIDKDLQAIAYGEELKAEDQRFAIEHCSFADIAGVVDRQKAVDGVDGILLDLGVSSPQLDQAERGFSFLRDGPLDMRMDTSRGISAADWVNVTDEYDMTRIFRLYGEERFAKRIANAIAQERVKKPFTTTAHLAEVVKAANPKWERDKHPATRVFQAIRIEINNELSDLEYFLNQVLSVLKPGGRIVIISFHSLEDRIVKRFFKQAAKGKDFPKGMPVTVDMLQPELKLMSRAIKASKGEVDSNTRSRSAVMRVGEKLGGASNSWS
jgi:16S rRNA (cytosine1402-N4)-methyltransferase